MNKRNKINKARQNQYKWKSIGMFSNRKCEKCGEKTLIQIYKHDAWACITCNEWLEKACDSVDCPFCFNRPKTPYEVYWREDIEAGSAGDRKHWRRLNYQHKMSGEVRKKYDE